MVEDLLVKLKAIDPSILAEVVRQDRRSPSFEITDWTVRRLSDKGIRNPDGLWLFRGDGQDGLRSQAWSVVLKILERPEQESPLSDPWYWKRELLWVKSGLIEQLLGPVKSPRFYRVEETADGAWLWQEYVENHRPDPWRTEDYAFAAHQLGLWNGICSPKSPIPAEPWFARQHYRFWYTKTNPEVDFQFPLNQKHISGKIKSRYDQLWADREMFYRVLETLPQTFSHFDSQRRNLFIRNVGANQSELVIGDWAMCGLGPLGAELYSLAGMSAALMEYPPSALDQLDVAVFQSYVQGLHESGWFGNVDTVRLAYLAWTAVWLGTVFPNFVALWCTPDFLPYALQSFGFAEEDLCLQWLPLLSYSLDCADEARFLMKKLGMV